jgi:zinc/manganese transport system substrate-binding protein
MKRLTLKWLACAALTAPLLLQSSQAAEPIPVVASFSILGDLVQVVGGDRIKVQALVGPDADAHVFEPSPADAKAIMRSRLFVTNGLDFEHWAQKLAKSAGYKGATLVASQGVKPRTMPADDHPGQTETDPHAWQDPTNVMIYVKNIAKSLSSIDPQGSETYQKNAEAYLKELDTLDAWAKEQFADLTPHQRQMITSHDAFGYFGAHYKIRVLAPQGVSTESEPSAKEVARLIRQIKKDKINAVFMENMTNPKLISQLAKDTGVTLGPKLYVDALSGPNEPASSYLKLMQHNVTQLVAGMKLN